MVMWGDREDHEHCPLQPCAGSRFVSDGKHHDRNRSQYREQRCRGGPRYGACDGTPAHRYRVPFDEPADEPGHQHANGQHQPHKCDHGEKEDGDPFGPVLELHQTLGAACPSREVHGTAPGSLLRPQDGECNQDQYHRKHRGRRAVDPPLVLGVDDPGERIEAHEGDRSEVGERVERNE